MFSVDDFNINKIFYILGRCKKDSYEEMEIGKIIIESGKLDNCVH